MIEQHKSMHFFLPKSSNIHNREHWEKKNQQCPNLNPNYIFHSLSAPDNPFWLYVGF